MMPVNGRDCQMAEKAQRSVLCTFAQYLDAKGSWRKVPSVIGGEHTFSYQSLEAGGGMDPVTIGRNSSRVDRMEGTPVPDLRRSSPQVWRLD